MAAGELWGCPGKVGLGAEAPEAVNQDWEASASSRASAPHEPVRLLGPEQVVEDAVPSSNQIFIVLDPQLF